MNKKIVSLIVFTIASTGILFAGNAVAKIDNDGVKKIENFSQSSVSQLIIQVPDVIRISDKNRIDVVDTQGQKIDTNISVNGKIIVLTFVNTVAPNTKLEIDINNIKRPIGGNGPVYQMSAKFGFLRT